MKKIPGVLVCALLLSTLNCFAQTAAAGNFQFRNIDVPGALATFASGINDRGQIVGFARLAPGVFLGYEQDAPGASLRTIAFPGARNTFPQTINNSGVIAGEFDNEDRIFHGFILDRGRFTTVDVPGAILVEIVDLNDRGDLVGAWEDANFGFHGFRRDKNGVITIIDDPDQTSSAPSTQAFGLNNRGNVNGPFQDAQGNFHGFLLEHGVFQTVDAPGAIMTAPEGMNNSDDMVGFLIGQDNVQHGFLKQGDDFITYDFPGAVGATFPFQVNDEGTILGIYFDEQGVTHSFIAVPQDDGEGEGSMTSGTAIRKAATSGCSLTDFENNPGQIRSARGCN